MFTVIIHGKKFRASDKGWTALFCPRCKCAQAFLIQDNYQKDSLYFIEIAETKIEQLATCDFCGTTNACDTTDQFELDPDWDRKDGLQALVNSTNPGLTPVEHRERRGDQELEALLQSVHEKGAVAKIDVQIGIILGCILAQFFTLPLAYFLHSLGYQVLGDDLFGQIFGGIVAGMLVGSVTGAVVYLRLASQKISTGALQAALEKHKIDVIRLHRISLSCGARARRAVERLSSGYH